MIAGHTEDVKMTGTWEQNLNKHHHSCHNVVVSKAGRIMKVSHTHDTCKSSDTGEEKCQEQR